MTTEVTVTICEDCGHPVRDMAAHLAHDHQRGW